MLALWLSCFSGRSAQQDPPKAPSWKHGPRGWQPGCGQGTPAVQQSSQAVWLRAGWKPGQRPPPGAWQVAPAAPHLCGPPDHELRVSSPVLKPECGAMCVFKVLDKAWEQSPHTPGWEASPLSVHLHACGYWVGCQEGWCPELWRSRQCPQQVAHLELCPSLSTSHRGLQTGCLHCRYSSVERRGCDTQGVWQIRGSVWLGLCRWRSPSSEVRFTCALMNRSRFLV
nr:uncharacterized protein LOC108404370 isoform X2 [Manis javanica]